MLLSLAAFAAPPIDLDAESPYYPGLNYPKLVTPQWVGEEGVDAVVILAIDDMRDHRRYETVLRPILDRLKQILESLGPALVPPALSALLDAWGGDFRSAPRCGTFRLPTEGFGKVSSLARYVKGGLIGFGTLALIGVVTLKARQGLTFGGMG